MSENDRIHAEVSKAYGAAVRGESCCCGGGKAKTKGAAANFAGYGAQERADLPDDAVVNSFGCGNPLAFAEVRSGETVVDLGSGAGIDLLLAARKVGPQGRVIGVDMTDDMIEAARRNIAAAGLANVEVRKGIIEELPVEASTVDWVISNCVINLSPDKPRVFFEIARVLRPGGRMMVSDIVADELPDWLRESARAYSACLGGAISEADYVAGLQAAGLVDVEVRERIVYDAAQLEALVESEEMGAAFSCCGGGPPKALVRKAVGEVAGKIWSAKFFARKP